MITIKQIRTIIIFLLFVGIGSNHLRGQDNKNTISISGIAAHFVNNEKYHLIGPFQGYYESKIDPGFEILFYRPCCSGYATKLATAGADLQSAPFSQGIYNPDINEI